MNHKTKLQFTLLILAAEIIYTLPFVMIRIFRDTISTAFNITNQNIGVCFTLYGITALLSYIHGGLIADKYQPKYLMSIALFLTGIGGFFWVYFPSLETLYSLYIYWGITTVMFFWSPLIKAIRILGEKQHQVTSFSILESGRGIVAGIVGIIGILVINLIIPDENFTKSILKSMMNFVYLITSILIIFIAFLMLLLPDFGETSKITSKDSSGTKLLIAFKHPIIWILMVIIFTSYTGYKITGVFTQYVSESYQYSVKESTILGTVHSFLRFIVCLLIVVFAKKATPSKWLIISYCIMAIGSLILIFNQQYYNISLILSITIPAIGVYALRGLYFTLLEEAKVPIQITGTMVGIISIVAYSPELFIGQIEGFFLDELDGTNGFKYLFVLLFLCAIIGLICSILFHQTNKQKNEYLST